MIIQCPSCTTRYHYDETRFQGVPAKKIKCTKCSSIFEIRNPTFGASPTPSDFNVEQTGSVMNPLLGSDDFSLDTTVMGGPRPFRRPPGPPPGSVPVPPPLPPVAPRPAVPPPVPVASSASTDAHPKTAGPTSANDPRLKLPTGMRLSLACLAGPDSGRIFEIDRPRVTMGRANADIVLTDPQCSRNHAAIEVMEDQVFVVDLASTNGTFMGEKRITRAEVENRAEFDLGGTTLMLIKTRRE